MLGKFGSSVEQKNDALVMQVAAELLNALKIQDKDQFLKDFVTTLFNTIYIPFIIGVEDSRWSLWGQVRVCVHEHQHVIQGGRDGWAQFSSKYLTSSSFRAGCEGEAFGCDLEMEFWRTGQILNIDQRASVLKGYGCSDEDIEMVKQMLNIRADVVRQGVIETESAKVAIDWLEAHVDGLRELR
jgi:hypothetical protein